MTRAPVTLLGLIGQLLLPCEGIALRAEPTSGCLDAVPGESCHKFVTWALAKGIEKHPEFFPSFKRSDSDEQDFKQVQEILYTHGTAGCDKPCSTPTAAVEDAAFATPAEALATPAEALAAAVEEAAPAKPIEVQTTPDAEALATPAEAPATDEEDAAFEAEAAIEAEAAPAKPNEEVKPVEVPAAAAQEAAPSAQAKLADSPAPAAQEQRPRSNLIGTLEAELKALEAMKDSPALEPLRAEKRQFIKNLQTADKLEAEFKARQSQTPQKIDRLEAELKALEAMGTTPASKILTAEKRTLIQKLQTADTADAEQTARHLQRLQDPAAAAEEATPVARALEQERPQEPQEPQEGPPRSELISKLEAELSAMDQLHDSPSLELLRAEKRQLINNLQMADKVEAELKQRQLQNVQRANKLEADIKTLEAMDGTDTPALEPLREEKRTLLHNLQTADKSDTEQMTQELHRLQDPAESAKEEVAPAPAASAGILQPEAAAAERKPWWQRPWREAKAKAKEEAVKEEQTNDEAQTTPAETPAVAAEEAKTEAVPAAAAEEAKPAEAPAPAAMERLGGCLDAVPGDRCHEFVTWALAKGIEKHPDWFPSFKRSDSDEQDFKQMQEVLYSANKAGCAKPCSA